MDNPVLIMTIAVTTLLSIAMLSVFGLKSFAAWISLKQSELQMMNGTAAAAPASAANRIEVADLKERLRKLEAIAAGVDL